MLSTACGWRLCAGHAALTLPPSGRKKHVFSQENSAVKLYYKVHIRTSNTKADFKTDNNNDDIIITANT